MEDAVGRTVNGQIPLAGKNSHIVLARVDGAYGVKRQLIRLPMLFGQVAPGKEEGLYFVGLVFLLARVY